MDQIGLEPLNFEGRRIICFDLETYRFAPGRMAPPMVCMSWTDGERVGLVKREEGLRLARMWLEDDTVLLVNQNIAFDMAVIAAANPDLFMPLIFAAYARGRIVCTMVYQQLLDIANGQMNDGSTYSLEATVRRRFGESVEGKHGEDVWRLRYRELENVAIADWPEEARRYVINDSVLALRCFLSMVEEGDLPNVAEQCRAAWVLQLIRCWGIRTDGESVEALNVRLHDHVDHNLVKLVDAGIYRMGGTKKAPKLTKNEAEVKRRVFAELGQSAGLTEGGEARVKDRGGEVFEKDVAINVEQLEKCKDPALLLLAEISGDQKLLNTYIPLLRQGVSGPLHPYWNTLVNSGRNSCIAKGTLIDIVRDIKHPKQRIPIEDVRQWDWAYTFNAFGQPILQPVLWAGQTGTMSVIRVHWRSPQADRSGHLDLTSDHRVRLSGGLWVEAGQLKPGVSLMALHGRVRVDYEVEALEVLEGVVDVYDLKIQETENFIANELCVHNCSKPNLQNQPRKPGVRECFVPRPGWVFISSDYHTAELRSLAQVLLDWYGESQMAEALRAGKDLHLVTGASIISATYEDMMTWYKGHHAPGCTDKSCVAGCLKKKAKDGRQLAKCFHPETEVLTRKGWVRIDQLDPKEEVAAAIPRDGGGVDIVWRVPTRLTSRPSPGHLVHLRNENIDLRVTEDHRMVAFTGSKFRNVKTVLPKALNKARYWPSAGNAPEGDIEVDERLLRLAVAVQADGNYPPEGHQIKLGFCKRRKIERMEQLLEGFEYKRAVHRNGENKPTTAFTLDRELAERIKPLLTPGKTLPWWWLNLTPKLRAVVIDEVKHWDGSAEERRVGYDFSSTIKSNVDVLQAIASITGWKCTAAVEKGVGNRADCWTLSLKPRHLTRGENLETTVEAYDGLVYCLTVDTDAVLVRDKGKTVVTRQCSNFGLPGGLGAATFMEFAAGPDYRITLTLDESKQLKESWLSAYPEMIRYFADIGKMCNEGGGRFTLVQPHSGRLRGNSGFTQSANSNFQGLTADGMKDASFHIAREQYDPTYRHSPLYGTRTNALIHDEVFMESPEEQAAEAGERVSEIMVERMSHWLPDIPVTAEAALMRRWSKAAGDAVRNKQGRLIPWEDREK